MDIDHTEELGNDISDDGAEEMEVDEVDALADESQNGCGKDEVDTDDCLMDWVYICVHVYSALSNWHEYTDMYRFYIHTYHISILF